MINIPFETLPKQKIHKNVDEFVHFDLRGKSSKDKVKLLILRDLMNVNWDVNISNNKFTVSPPKEYTKETVRTAMAMKRLEILEKDRQWIRNHLSYAQENLATGMDAISSEIKPVIEVCETQKQLDLFRILRYYWSSPYSEYVGRRIKLIVRDHGLPNKPIIGIAALGSPIIHIPERDSWVGWDPQTRTQNLIYTMDAYVIGALPPYNYLLGGKLISYLLASKEVRKIYSEKYKDQITLIDKKVSNKLVGLFTTSLYGHSAQYNRISYNDELLYKPIGQTKGYGTLHLSKQTITAMVEMLQESGKLISHEFGNGPSWVMRVIRTAGEQLGFEADYLLQHSFKRNIYFIPLAKNFKSVLLGESKRPIYTNYLIKDLATFWKERWLIPRKKNTDILIKALEFNPEQFRIL